MDDDKFRSYRDRDPVAREAPEQTLARGNTEIFWLSWLGSLAKAIRTLAATAGPPV